MGFTRGCESRYQRLQKRLGGNFLRDKPAGGALRLQWSVRHATYNVSHEL